jgi:hypothetical protein
MSAEDNLSKQLFHGSIRSLKPGTIINPQGEGATGHLSFATSKVETAQGFAGLATQRALGFSEHRMPAFKDAPTLFNPVYTVEPVDPQDVSKTEGREGVVESKKGFRVTGVHSYEPGWNLESGKQ